MTGLVLSDEDGVALAEAGDVEACREVAARLPLLGATISTFEGILLAKAGGYQVEMERVITDDSFLFLCAIGGRSSSRGKLLSHSKSGVCRILSNKTP